MAALPAPLHNPWRDFAGRDLFVLMWSQSSSITGPWLPLDALGDQSLPSSCPSAFPRLSTHRELVVEAVSEQGVWQLSEIGLAQGRDAVNVLQVNIFAQVWLPLCLELLPGEVERGQEWWGQGPCTWGTAATCTTLEGSCGTCA